MGLLTHNLSIMILQPNLQIASLIYYTGLSLTIMLVMYTMYQSITEHVTKTAYLKMIDYWLFFCLLMPFFIFMIEVYWSLQNKDDKQSNKNKDCWISEEKRKLKQQKCVLITIFGLTIAFILAYIVIAVVMYFSN